MSELTESLTKSDFLENIWKSPTYQDYASSSSKCKYKWNKKSYSYRFSYSLSIFFLNGGITWHLPRIVYFQRLFIVYLLSTYLFPCLFFIYFLITFNSCLGNLIVIIHRIVFIFVSIKLNIEGTPGQRTEFKPDQFGLWIVISVILALLWYSQGIVKGWLIVFSSSCKKQQTIRLCHIGLKYPHYKTLQNWTRVFCMKVE